MPAVDDVASTCRGKGPVRAEEGPLGPIDESLEAREIEEVRAVEILRRAGIEFEPIDNSRCVAFETEMSVPTV